MEPDPDALRGEVALVAGATRGAGKGVAAALGEAGATVVCTGRSSHTGSLRSDCQGRSETVEDTAELVDVEHDLDVGLRILRLGGAHRTVRQLEPGRGTVRLRPGDPAGRIGAGPRAQLDRGTVDRPGAALGREHRGLRFARSLTGVLLASSVAGNTVVHGLSAYRLTAPWWLVVAVSAVAPAVLGAVVHLAVLVGRPSAGVQSTGPGGLAVQPTHRDELAVQLTDDDVASDPLPRLGRRRLAAELGITEHQARVMLAERNGTGR